MPTPYDCPRAAAFWSFRNLPTALSTMPSETNPKSAAAYRLPINIKPMQYAIILCSDLLNET
jgi:hypothetical protein